MVRVGQAGWDAKKRMAMKVFKIKKRRRAARFLSLETMLKFFFKIHFLRDLAGS